MTDISGELVKRISRRQFLFGGRNSGGGGSEAGVLGAVLGAAGIGIGVMALGSPGPNAQSFQDAYVQKRPVSYTGRNPNYVRPGGVAGINSNRGLAFRYALDDAPALADKVGGFFSPEAVAASAFIILGVAWDETGAFQGGAFVNPSPSIDFPGNTAILIGSGVDDLANVDSFDWGSNRGEQRNIRLSTQAYDAYNSVFSGGTIGRSLFINTATILGRPDRLAWREDATPANLRNAVASDELDQTTTGLVSIGPPAAAAGSTNRFADQGHRHGSSARFVSGGHGMPLGLGAGFPFLFERVQINANWTLRRLWVYAQVGPTGGTETYAVTNAAGAVQGTAVVLPAGAGPTQAITALQVTNLTGATAYYVSQTAIGAGWAAGSIEPRVGFEYTMNA